MRNNEKMIIRLYKLMGDLNVSMDSIKNISLRINKVNADFAMMEGALPDRKLIACAAYLHHFYTGIESMLKRIEFVIDGGPLIIGDNRELLRSMAYEILNIRPAIIPLDLAEELEEYRTYREMFRSAEGSEL